METENGGCIAVPVHNYEQAVKVCRKLANEGLFAIELCGGFGHLGTARIVSAVEGKVPIGVVSLTCTRSSRRREWMQSSRNSTKDISSQRALHND